MSGSGTTLDERYIDFVARTRSIFEAHPRLESMRYAVFKHLLATRQAMGLGDAVKQWVRPLVHREHTAGPLPAGDVLVWIESNRATSIAGLLNVYRELAERDVATQAVAMKGPDELAQTAIQFRYVPHILPPSWAREAWDAFEAEYPELRDPGLKRAFLGSAAVQTGLYDEIGRVLDALRPKLVLIFSRQIPGGAALSVAARERGILSVELQHGVLQPFFTPLVTDVMVTWGESSNQTLTGLGVDGTRLIPLGSPRHDEMRPLGEPGIRQRFLQTLNLEDRPTLVFFSNGNDLVRNGNAPVECADWLETVAAQIGDRFNVVVRLHPNEDGSLYAHCPHLTVTKGELDMATTLEACDVVGSLCSTVLVEGLLYDKPIWQFYADGWPDLADNWKTGLATRIASAAELGELAQRVVQQGAARLVDRRLKERAFANHGHATHVIADYVETQLASL